MIAASFAHVGITCQDPIVIERFYTKYFHFQRARVVAFGGEQILFLKSGSVYLELFKAKEHSPLAPPQADGYAFPGLRHLAFDVPNVDAKLAEFGPDVRIMLGPLDFGDFIPGWRGAWIADPEGNIIEISEGYVDQQNPPPLEG